MCHVGQERGFLRTQCTCSDVVMIIQCLFMKEGRYEYDGCLCGMLVLI